MLPIKFVLFKNKYIVGTLFWERTNLFKESRSKKKGDSF